MLLTFVFLLKMKSLGPSSTHETGLPILTQIFVYTPLVFCLLIDDVECITDFTEDVLTVVTFVLCSLLLAFVGDVTGSVSDSLLQDPS